MIVRGLLLLLLLIAPAEAEGTKPACELTRFATVPVETLPDGRIGIPVTVQHRPAVFMVDTGGAVATINYAQVQEMPGVVMKQSPRYLVGVGGTVMSSYVTVDQFSIGQLNGSGLALYVETRGLEDVDGTLAPDMLQNYDLDIDFAGSKLSLFSQKHCPGKVVYWTTMGFVALPMEVTNISGHVRVPVTVDGKNTMATLDTGARTSLISLSAAKALGVDERSPQLKSLGSAGGYETFSYPFHSLDFGGVAVSNPRIRIASDNFMKGLGSDLIIGIGILRQLHLYIAYKEQKLYITPALAQ
jgi:predicted aspartyl protease